MRAARRRPQPEVATGADRGGWRVAAECLCIGPWRALRGAEAQAAGSGVEPQAALRQRRVVEDRHARNAAGAAADRVVPRGIRRGFEADSGHRPGRSHRVGRVKRVAGDDPGVAEGHAELRAPDGKGCRSA